MGINGFLSITFILFVSKTLNGSFLVGILTVVGLSASIVTDVFFLLFVLLQIEKINLKTNIS